MIFSHGRHAKPSAKIISLIVFLMISLTASLILTATGNTGADAASVSWGPVNSPGNIALSWAESQAGKWYEYGTDGPSTYDCSGLVYAAFLREGINVGRDTYDMLDNAHLVRTYSPERGDLAFYGTGHVEFVTVWASTTFGAHDTGSRIGWIQYGGSWYPTAYYRVVK